MAERKKEKKMSELPREKRVECIARRILIYCEGMDQNPNYEKIILDSTKELTDLLQKESKIEGVAN